MPDDEDVGDSVICHWFPPVGPSGKYRHFIYFYLFIYCHSHPPFISLYSLFPFSFRAAITLQLLLDTIYQGAR